jgi:UDP-N-acetylmuramoylalanine--D-glutamate ligase
VVITTDLPATLDGSTRSSCPRVRAAPAGRGGRRGLDVYSEPELAWRMRPAAGAAPWLTLTGTNGKTTTVKMLAAMLAAAGRRAVAAGNVGTPLLEAVLHPDPFDVIAVELSSFQLTPAAAPRAVPCSTSPKTIRLARLVRRLPRRRRRSGAIRAASRSATRTTRFAELARVSR